ncbi:phosphoribosylglycinamide formyltransferase [Desulfosoma caldarium]|uniref:Phosphoribosylglycinamide formyltransferase n=1 Tax=Desulfosoma caldarium TaxID=610254 RepID=A0A3N1VFC7_9BACT|nr:phosphoribosylglycinamide formyltransferase [Desulfosoma caldarium]ROR01544.1 formyltetrahydrofolate-dependent phosphoribosylglycinamide formyltransferase [Desulfosoma caldarium]
MASHATHLGATGAHAESLSKRLRIGVLISGSGTNLQALIDQALRGTLDANIVCVGSDRAAAYGLVRAHEAGIATFVVSYEKYLKGDPIDSLEEAEVEAVDARQRILRDSDEEARRDRLKRLMAAEREILAHLECHGVELVCLAGFMRLLTPYFLDRFRREDRPGVVNIHPALLPAFPGQHGYRDTYLYGCKWGGITIHFVDEGEDTGPVIAQAVYPIWDEDTCQDVRQRGLHLEHLMYAQVVNWIARDQVRLVARSEGRARVLIDDPAYREVVGSWVEAAFRDRPGVVYRRS